MYTTNTMIPLKAFAMDNQPSPGESLAQGEEWDAAHLAEKEGDNEYGLSPEAQAFLERIGELDELEIHYAEMGKRFAEADPDNARAHDDVRRSFNKAVNDEIYPENQMHFPMPDAPVVASTECARTPTECMRLRAMAQAMPVAGRAYVDVMSDESGLVAMSIGDVKDMVKQLASGKVRAEVSVKGIPVTAETVGSWLAGEAGEGVSYHVASRQPKFKIDFVRS